MPVKRQKKSRRPLFALLALLLVAGVIAGVFLVRHNNAVRAAEAAAKEGTNNPTGTINYSPPPKADNTANEERKNSNNPGDTLNSSQNTTPKFSVQMNPVVNNGNVHVGTQVNGVTSGSCSLTASQNGQSTLQLGTHSVTQDVNIYDCGVFNSTFPSKGSWQLTLTVTSGGVSASTTNTVRID